MKRFKDFNKLYEFEETTKIPYAESAAFMDELYSKIKEELMPTLPTEFKLNYVRGKEVIISTGNSKDLKVGAKIDNDKMVLYSYPIGEPAFEINYNFTLSSVNDIVKVLRNEFEKSKNGGLSSSKTVSKTTRTPIKRNLKSFNAEEDDIDTPITDKPKKIKRSINIKLIKSVLEDAYILDEIDLHTVTIDELVRRMLVQGRKK